jgi:hypothetical protein
VIPSVGGNSVGEKADAIAADVAVVAAGGGGLGL